MVCVSSAMQAAKFFLNKESFHWSSFQQYNKPLWSLISFTTSTNAHWMSNHSLWMPFEHSTFSFILQAHSSIKVTSKICPLIMPFSGDFHCQELHDYNDLVFSLIDSFLAQLEHSSPLKALNQYEFSALSESGKKFSSWAFQAGNPSPLVSVSLVHSVFFLMPISSKCLSRRLC